MQEPARRVRHTTSRCFHGLQTRATLRLLHPIKRLLQEFEVARVSDFRARRLDPFLLEHILRWAIGFKEDTEKSWEW